MSLLLNGYNKKPYYIYNFFFNSIIKRVKAMPHQKIANKVIRI